MRGAIVTVVGLANGGATPFDGEYVVSWDPHTRFGICTIKTTKDKDKARVFASFSEAFEEYRTVSRVQPRRPTDGQPNRPLTGLTVVFDKIDAAAVAS